MTRKFALLLAASALVVPALAQSPKETAKKPVGAAVGPVKAQAPALAADKPQIGSFGFDEAGMDKSVAPGDDFYLYGNGTWGKATAIPADKSSYGAFDTLADLSDERTKGILEDAAKDPDSKIGIAVLVKVNRQNLRARAGRSVS